MSLIGRLWSGKPNTPAKPPKNPKFALTLSHFVIPEGENSNTHTQSSRDKAAEPNEYLKSLLPPKPAAGRFIFRPTTAHVKQVQHLKN